MTVGTHEQPFDRLMREVGRLVAEGALEDAVVQYGYSTVVPAGCRAEAFLPYGEMQRLFREADAVVTHGGPSSFIEAISAGKVPVVVPRLERFGEHVNDHQARFVEQYARRVGGIIPVEDVSELGPAIARAARASGDAKLKSNNALFCQKLGALMKGL